MTKTYRLVQQENPQADDIVTIRKNLQAYNLAQVGYGDEKQLAFFIRNQEDTIVGGIVGWAYWDWLAVDFLWVHEDLRSQGYGSQLLAAIEAAAIARGCKNALLDTFSFQAPEFYRKRGYEVYGELHDFPPGHTRYFMTKVIG